jgi:hypothetical protein
VTLEDLLFNAIEELHSYIPDIDIQELEDRQMVMSISPSLASFTDLAGNERPLVALEVLAVNALGNPKRSVLMFAPEAMAYVANILTRISQELQSKEEEPTPSLSRYGYL